MPPAWRLLHHCRTNAGGSGRKSLAKLATYIAEQKCFTIQISRNYRTTEFREDLKELYRVAGGQNMPVVFLFDETQIKYEQFLEDINNILTSGEVPNLFGRDELPGICDEVSCFKHPSSACHHVLTTTFLRTMSLSRRWHPSLFPERRFVQQQRPAESQKRRMLCTRSFWTGCRPICT
jgi:P-loop containing dynein motor region D4